jgi:hypothetical protein
VYKEYLWFWRVLILLTLILGTVSLFWAGKNFYASDLLNFNKKQEAIHGLKLLDSKLIFSSRDSNCQFEYEVDIEDFIQTEEALKFTTSIDAEIMFVDQVCGEPIETVFLKLKEYQFGTYDKFIHKKKNTGAVYFFFAVLCLGISLLSLIMLKVTSWLFKKIIRGQVA